VIVAALLAAAAPAAAACDLRHAEPTTARTVGAHPDAWIGRCVRLEGLTVGRTFYDDIGGMYRATATDRDDRLNEGWLGMYFEEARADIKTPLRATVAGIVHDCERDDEAAQAAAGPDVLVMMVGYCHYHPGLVLLNAVTARRQPVRLVRQIGDKARRDYGGLLTVAEAGPAPEGVPVLVGAFAKAFAANDLAALDRLVDSYDTNRPEGEKALVRWRASLFGDKGAFRNLRAAGLKDLTFLKAREAKGESGWVSDPTWFACFCTASGCRGRWPISASDTQAEAKRPYMCLRVYHEPTEERPLALGLGLLPNSRKEPPAPSLPR